MADLECFSKNMKERLGDNRFESILLNGLGHFDTSDRYMYDQYTMNSLNTIMGNGWSKSQGNHS